MLSGIWMEVVALAARRAGPWPILVADGQPPSQVATAAHEVAGRSRRDLLCRQPGTGLLD